MYAASFETELPRIVEAAVFKGCISFTSKPQSTEGCIELNFLCFVHV